MEGQGVWRKSKGVGDLSRWHAARPGLDKKAVGIKTIVLSQRGQCCDSVSHFHISTNMEICWTSQGVLRQRLK
jgi:hypothetical protein